MDQHENDEKLKTRILFLESNGRAKSFAVPCQLIPKNRFQMSHKDLTSWFSAFESSIFSGWWIRWLQAIAFAMGIDEKVPTNNTLA